MRRAEGKKVLVPRMLRNNKQSAIWRTVYADLVMQDANVRVKSWEKGKKKAINCILRPVEMRHLIVGGRTEKVMDKREGWGLMMLELVRNKSNYLSLDKIWGCNLFVI